MGEAAETRGAERLERVRFAAFSASSLAFIALCGTESIRRVNSLNAAELPTISLAGTDGRFATIALPLVREKGRRLCVQSQEIRSFSVDPFEKSWCLMKFRLLYSGRLLGASRSDTRAEQKQQIRAEFNPQLKRLWATNEGLFRIPELFAREWVSDHPDVAKKIQEQQITEEEWRGFGMNHLAREWERCGKQYIPLVTEKMELRCKLDILFLRPQQPGRIVQGGDLDNRLKTLFDALRLPQNLDEAGKELTAEPIYCLLEDDKLISEVRVVTDSLLLLPKEKDADPNDVFLVIEVELEAPVHSKWKFAF